MLIFVVEIDEKSNHIGGLTVLIRLLMMNRDSGLLLLGHPV